MGQALVPLEAMNQGILKRAQGHLGVLILADAIPDNLSVPAIQNNNRMAPAGILAEKMRHISGPALV